MKMFASKFGSLIGAFGVSLLPFVASAAGVTDVQGNITNGSTLVINGSGFGTKPHGVKPLFYWSPGEQGNTQLNPNSRRTSWDAAPARGTIAANTVVPGSKYSYEITNFSGGGGVIDGMVTGLVPDLYIFHKWRTNWDGQDALTNGGNTWNMKGWRWTDGALGAGFSHDIVEGYGYGDKIPNGDPRYFYENTTDGGAYYGGSGLVKDSWRTEELQIHQGDMNVANASTKVSWNGKQEVNYTEKSLTSSFGNMYQKLFTHQFERVTASASWRMWYDIVYVDDSWCRVVVSDQATWSTSVTRGIEIQIPVAWTDTSISVVLRQGALGTLTDKYLYVITSNGNPVSTTGYKLTGTAQARPEAPSGVSVRE